MTPAGTSPEQGKLLSLTRMYAEPDLIVQGRSSLSRRHQFKWPGGLTLRQRGGGDTAGLTVLLSQDDFQRNGWTLEPITSEKEAEAFLRSQSPFAFEVVAHLDDKIVGFAGVYPLAGRQRHTGTLTLCAHESYQRQGVGTALMKCLIATAWLMMGLTRLQLTVFVDNARAIRLYRRFDFVEEGTIRNFVERPDGFVDAYLMALLHPAAHASQARRPTAGTCA